MKNKGGGDIFKQQSRSNNLGHVSKGERKKDYVGRTSAHSAVLRKVLARITRSQSCLIQKSRTWQEFVGTHAPIVCSP